VRNDFLLFACPFLQRLNGNHIDAVDVRTADSGISAHGFCSIIAKGTEEFLSR
jgi:hypothetical protein